MFVILIQFIKVIVFLQVALSLIATCIVLKIYFKNPALSEMPVWLRHVVLGVFGKLFRIRANKRKPILADIDILNCHLDDSPFLKENSALNGHHETNRTAGVQLQTDFTGTPLETLRRATESLVLPYRANRGGTVRSVSFANLVNGDCYHAPPSGAVSNGSTSLLRAPEELTRSSSMISTPRERVQSDTSDVSSQERFVDKSKFSTQEKENEVYAKDILKQQAIAAQQLGRLLLVAQEQEKEKIRKDEWVLVASIIDYGFLIVFLIMLFFSTVILFTLSG